MLDWSFVEGGLNDGNAYDKEETMGSTMWMGRRTWASLGAAALAGGLQAATCVWTGASGRWSDAANWRDGLRPAAGDTVYVSNRVGRVTIALDEPNVSLASIRFEGEGPVSLTGEALTLTGRFQAVGTSEKNVIDLPASRFPWFAWNAAVTCRVPLTFAPANAREDTGIWTARQNAVFERPITIVGERRFLVHGGYQVTVAEHAAGQNNVLPAVTFLGEVNGPQATFQTIQYPNGICTAYAPIRVKHMRVSSWGSAALCLGATGNSWETIRTDYNNRYLALVAGAYPSNSVFALAWDAPALGTWAFFNLGLHDTTIDRLDDASPEASAQHARATAGNCILANTTANSDRQGVEAPVTLTLRGTADGCSALAVQTKVSLVWDPVGDFTQTLTGRVSETTGMIAVRRGTLAFAAGTRFPNVRRYEIAPGARLALAADVALEAHLVQVGEAVIPSGTYSGVAAEGVTQVDWLRGAGTLHVDTTAAAIWKAPVSGDWDDGANWLGGGAPSADTPTYLVAPSASDYTVTVRKPVAAFPSHLAVGNAGGGTATLACEADVSVSSASHSVLEVARGGCVQVAAGARFCCAGMEPQAYAALDNPSRQDARNRSSFRLAGGTWLNDGGETVFTNYIGNFVVREAEGVPGRLIVRGGRLGYMNLGSEAPLHVLTGGGVDVRDARLDMPHHGYNHLTDLDVAGGTLSLSNTAFSTEGTFPETPGGGSITFGTGTSTLSGDAFFRLKGGYCHVKPGGAGQTARLVFTGHASSKTDYRPIFVGQTAGGEGILDYQGTNGAQLCVHVGVDEGRGTFRVPAGAQAAIHPCGLFVGVASDMKSAALPNKLEEMMEIVGDVDVAGSLAVEGSFHPGWAAGQRPSGLAVGYGCTKAERVGRPYIGRMRVSGAYSQKFGHALIGTGYGVGAYVQTGGTATFFTQRDVRAPLLCSRLLVGFAGGEGRLAVSNGAMRVQNGSVYVGGCDTNDLYLCTAGEVYGSNITNPDGWAAYGCPVERFADGVLTVAGSGAFTADHAVTVGARGTGVVEVVGSQASLTVQDLVLSNRLAATVRFVADAAGVAPIAVRGTLAIAPGAALDVDLTDWNGTGTIPLFTYAACTGAFDEATVTARAGDRQLPAALLQSETGIRLALLRGTQIILR